MWSLLGWCLGGVRVTPLSLNVHPSTVVAAEVRHRRRGLQFRGLSVFALLYLLPVLPLASTGIRM
jgi:hypothetical protein